MSIRIFKRRRSIFHNIISRMSFVVFFFMWSNYQNKELIDWLGLTLSVLMLISLAIEVSRLVLPVLEIIDGKKIVFKGLLKTNEVSNITFARRFGWNFIFFSDLDGSRIGSLLKSDLDLATIEMLSTLKRKWIFSNNSIQLKPRRERVLNLTLQYAQYQLFTRTLFAKSTR